MHIISKADYQNNFSSARERKNKLEESKHRMTYIALAGAIAIADKLVLILNQYVGDNAVCKDVEEVKACLNTLKSYLRDTEGREGNEGFKDRVEKMRNLAYETEDAIDNYMYAFPEHLHHNRCRQVLHDVAQPDFESIICPLQ